MFGEKSVFSSLRLSSPCVSPFLSDIASLMSAGDHGKLFGASLDIEVDMSGEHASHQHAHGEGFVLQDPSCVTEQYRALYEFQGIGFQPCNLYTLRGSWIPRFV